MKCVGLCPAFVVELWGVLEGLCCVRRLGFTKVELNTDSEAVGQLVKEGRVTSLLGNTLAKQRKLLEFDWIIDISHTYCEVNKCVDGLANFL
ncbi:ribonuclease H protein [Trifolium medium]|uniref:Ribonuclease H protein n=1 Tax=Trifolium medium TaxID=97028 RepID=A0A392NE03_9FABA|nr:ribonuclease H protein [Trifolium medium]